MSKRVGEPLPQGRTIYDHVFARWSRASHCARGPTPSASVGQRLEGDG